jgi:hypothetical protein
LELHCKFDQQGLLASRLQWHLHGGYLKVKLYLCEINLSLSITLHSKSHSMFLPIPQQWCDCTWLLFNFLCTSWLC